MLPTQAEILNYLGFLRGSVYNSNSCKLARKDYSTYNVTIRIPVLFLFCKLKHKVHLEANRTLLVTRDYSLCPLLMAALFPLKIMALFVSDTYFPCPDI